MNRLVLALLTLVLAFVPLGAPAASGGSPGFSIADVSVSESGGFATLTITKNAAAKSWSRIIVTTADGTAKAPGDYSATSVTLTFGNAQLAQTVKVPIVNDARAESSETFTVSLTAVRNATLDRASATVTIVDDDAQALAWVKCADEGGVCTISGTADVRYGAGTSWVVRTITGSVACSNAVFGDPIVGTVKECDTTGAVVIPTPTPTPTPTPAPSPPAGLADGAIVTATRTCSNVWNHNGVTALPGVSQGQAYVGFVSVTGLLPAWAAGTIVSAMPVGLPYPGSPAYVDASCFGP